jgi:CheY-like chemotaxis protein
MFDARHPDQPVVSIETSAPLRLLAPTLLAPEVLAKVGETFSVALSALQATLATLAPLPLDPQAALGRSLAEAARLEQLGISIQELGRILAGGSSLPCERIELAAAAQAVIAQWAPPAQRERIALLRNSEPIDVDVNAAALAQLVELALTYALDVGSGVEVSCAAGGRAAHPTLMIRSRCERLPEETIPEAPLDSLSWLLFVHLAHAVGLAPQRLVEGPVVILTLGFPAEAAQPAEIAAIGTAKPRPVVAGGRHVLLVEPREATRFEALRLLRGVGMDVDPAATLAQAIDSVHQRAPDIIVSGLSGDDRACRGLIDAARAAQPGLRVVELVDDDDAFAFAAGADRPARVGRHELGRTLLAAMAQELDAAWWP